MKRQSWGEMWGHIEGGGRGEAAQRFGGELFAKTRLEWGHWPRSLTERLQTQVEISTQRDFAWKCHADSGVTVGVYGCSCFTVSHTNTPFCDGLPQPAGHTLHHSARLRGQNHLGDKECPFPPAQRNEVIAMLSSYPCLFGTLMLQNMWIH